MIRVEGSERKVLIDLFALVSKQLTVVVIRLTAFVTPFTGEPVVIIHLSKLLPVLALL
jgi:hypothetical protein